MSVWFLTLSLSLAQNPQPAPNADDLIKKIDSTPDMKGREKPFEIASSLARLYFSQGRTKDAQGYAREAIAAAEPALKFYVEQKKKLGGGKPASDADAKCDPEKKESNLVNLLEVAKKHASAGRGAAAVTCARKAVAGVPEVLLLEANASFLNRDLAAARAGFERVLSTFDDVPEALYSRGALTLDESPDDVKALERAKADLEKFLAAAPQSPRVKNAKALLERAKAGIAAGGISKLTPVAVAVAPQPPTPPMQGGPTAPPPLSPETIAAFQNAPSTPETEAKFTKLIEDAEDALAKGQYQDALGGFRQVMPYQPTNPRLRAGMAWTLVRLGKPMADTVWRAAMESPEAIDQLGDRLKAKGDVEGAKALWGRLAETVPQYAPRLEGKR